MRQDDIQLFKLTFMARMIGNPAGAMTRRSDLAALLLLGE
jgi:hypothetical protein